MVDAEYFKEPPRIWIDRYRALELQVTDPLAALLIHDIILELELGAGEPAPCASKPDAPNDPT